MQPAPAIAQNQRLIQQQLEMQNLRNTQTNIQNRQGTLEANVRQVNDKTNRLDARQNQIESKVSFQGDTQKTLIKYDADRKYSDFQDCVSSLKGKLAGQFFALFFSFGGALSCVRSEYAKAYNAALEKLHAWASSEASYMLFDELAVAPQQSRNAVLERRINSLVQEKIPEVPTSW